MPPFHRGFGLFQSAELTRSIALTARASPRAWSAMASTIVLHSISRMRPIVVSRRYMILTCMSITAVQNYRELHRTTPFYLVSCSHLSQYVPCACARVRVAACNSTDQFPCGLGPCVDAERYCDNTPDCLDGSDEVRGCRKYTCTFHALPLIAAMRL